MGDQDQRLNPNALLELINSETQLKQKGKLRVFLGMSAGVGKTYAMLRAAQQKQAEGVQVLIGVVETHGRSETSSLLSGLNILPKKKIRYRNTNFEELDVDEVLKQKPQLVLIDELAHSNAPGSRHSKRYQDILEILDSGIDVYTALNVQHLESRKDNVEQITGIPIRETVPDSILEQAQMVELVDIAPTELLKRLREGKVYLGDKATLAAENFFKEDKLTALREIALRMTAERVDQDLQRFTISRDSMPWQTNERLLVAISHSPYSERIIRVARRLAYNLEAPWIGIHVDTGLTLSDEDQLQLQKNLNLARELKAEVVNTTDTNLVSAIKRISRQKNVTQIIVGRPTRRWFRDFIEGGSLLERLVRESQEIDVHVVRYESEQRYRLSLKDELSLYRTRTGFMKYYYVFWFFVFTSMVGAAVEKYIGYRAVGFVFLMTVFLMSLWGSIGVVFFSAVLSALIWNFGFIPPRFTFVITEIDDFILMISNFIVALVTGFLTNRIRIRENLIREREEKTNLMNYILQDISSSENKSEFISKVCNRISKSFGGSMAVALKSRNGDLTFDKIRLNEILTEKERAVALWSYQNNKNAGWSTETLSEAMCLYIPLRGVSEQVGVVIYKPERKIKKLTIDQKEFLISASTQLGISIERHFLSKRLQEAQRLKDSELLHQTLLNSISHEMRTPLTTIMGVANALENQSKLKSESELQGFVNSLINASDRLNRVIENLLDMSRINSGVIGLKLEWHDPTDLMGVVIKKLEKNLIGHPLKVTIPDDLGLIEIDFRLFEHALSNLVLNATQYGGANCSIEVVFERLCNSIQITVADNGIEIADEAQGLLFDKFYRVPGTPTGGTGLGLSIVKGIVELHKGKISYKTNKPKGSKFIILLPYKEQPIISSEVSL